MTAQEYLQLPDKRDLSVYPWTLIEQAAMATVDPSFDGLPELAATLVLKWHTIGNYQVSEQSLRSGLVAIRPLLGTAPAPVADPSQWNDQTARDRREGRLTFAEQQELNKSALADHDKEMEGLDKAIEAKVRDDKFESALGAVQSLVIGHASGHPDYPKTFRTRLEAYDKLKTEYAAYPEYVKRIDREIDETKARQRM
jgi:hypothetical protein